jgi:hypothetical protein
VEAGCDYSITTDDVILKKWVEKDIVVFSPIGFRLLPESIRQEIAARSVSDGFFVRRRFALLQKPVTNVPGYHSQS